MEFLNIEFSELLQYEGNLAVVASDEKLLKALDEATHGQIQKLEAIEDGEQANENWLVIDAPAGIAAKKLFFVRKGENMRKLGGKLAAALEGDAIIYGGDQELAFGFMLRNYRFEKYKAKPKSIVEAKFVVDDVKAFTKEFLPFEARAAGVHLARDLVNEPANILTTTEFANRISALEALGMKVEILDEKALEKIGMRALLGVGQGSESPSKVAIMHWDHGDDAPLALVGKGVVFDTGGISIKPSAGMEEMIMDMGGAASVVGTMHTLAARKAKANIVGIVGLVENMPDGQAQRPGDIVKTLKGDTVEVLNTDAEGRLVLADILWYVQSKYKPKAIIDMATLTGAIIIALGKLKAGVFGNDQEFTDQFLKSAMAEGEGAWQLPLDEEYNKQLKSLHAEMGNIGGREAGSITAAQFLQRFVEDGTPWIHLDIAGVAWNSKPSDLSEKGATGWGVLALDHLVSEHFER